jgi:outer membrane lipoprotein
MRYACLLPLALTLTLAGCAGSDCRIAPGIPSPAPDRALSGDLRTGEQVQWGGRVVQTRNLKDRTELEVVGYPLDGCGRPRLTAEPTGRFILIYPGYLEAADLAADRRVTATGRFAGIREGKVGDAPSRFPLLESFRPRLWPAEDTALAYPRPWISIGIGSGSYGGGGGIGVMF